MSPEKWLKQNLKSKCMAIDALPEALYNFERAALEKAFAKRIDSLSRLGLSNSDLVQRQEILKKELHVKLEKLTFIGRATIFRLMKGNTIKESTLSRLETFFDDKLFDNEINFVKNAPIVKGERTCKLCGFSNRKAHPDNWLRKDIDVDKTQIPTIHEVFLSTHRNKLFSGLPRSKYVTDKSLDKSERKKKQLTHSHENRNKYSLYVCSVCLIKATNTLQSNYSMLTDKILSDKSWNQLSLAKRLKVGQSVISRIKNGDIEFLQPKTAEEIHVIALCELSDKIISYKYSYTYDDHSEAFYILKMYGYGIDNYMFKYELENEEIYYKNTLPDEKGPLKIDLIIHNREYECGIGCCLTGNHHRRIIENMELLKDSKLSHICYFTGSSETPELRCFQLYPFTETDLPFAVGHLKVRSLIDKDDYQDLDNSMLENIKSYFSKYPNSIDIDSFHNEFRIIFNANMKRFFTSSPIHYSLRIDHLYKNKKRKM
ncbi:MULTISPECIES: hypothetical protein [Pseudoalteromonas]|uniref:hypothetical protein n=1 Tax=Pseudoalteromonas TaxID=53246 RepID=UPI0015825491|nr:MULTISPECIES: hypothetical protein [Pseudoalteromonas]MDI4653808.1 hypothetical protein [Pseudoalteromonas shioyasakiensis]NUJ40018.1 hypothetical protein [Pseudoalteromonas sp. 0303]